MFLCTNGIVRYQLVNIASLSHSSSMRTFQVLISKMAKMTQLNSKESSNIKSKLSLSLAKESKSKGTKSLS